MTSRNLVVALLAVFGASACGGDDGPTAFAVYPNQIYTGYEAEAGGPTYKVPIVANDSAATFSLEAGGEASVTLTPLGKGEAEIVSKAPGVARIVVNSPKGQLTVNVTVQLYTAADRQAGQAAYMAKDCGMCHDDPRGKNDNTPSAIAEHTDDAVMLNVTTGNDPDGTIIRDFHKFTGVPLGVVAYLRSLPARQKPGPNLFTSDDAAELE